jgi:replicative DNA helicase
MTLHTTRPAPPSRRCGSTPSAAHIEHYAGIVLEHAVRRRYITLASS